MVLTESGGWIEGGRLKAENNYETSDLVMVVAAAAGTNSAKRHSKCFVSIDSFNSHENPVW